MTNHDFDAQLSFFSFILFLFSSLFTPFWKPGRVSIPVMTLEIIFCFHTVMARYAVSSFPCQLLILFAYMQDKHSRVQLHYLLERSGHVNCVLSSVDLEIMQVVPELKLKKTFQHFTTPLVNRVASFPFSFYFSSQFSFLNWRYFRRKTKNLLSSS